MYYASGATDPEKIGQGKGPAQNPPPLGAGDMRAIEWFKDNCTEFDRAYGLTSVAFAELGLDAAQRRLFKWKLSAVMATALREETAKSAAENKHGL